MSIAIAPSKPSIVRAKRAANPNATDSELARMTGLSLDEVQQILAREPKRRRRAAPK